MSDKQMHKLTPEDGASMAIVPGNIEALRTLFPEAFGDGVINFDVLKQCLGEYADDDEERYALTWHGKSRARRISQTPSCGTLLPCREDSVDWETTKHIFIEGDNLEVLKLLQKSYHRKVRMIYIDPPYNTGKEFIYPDRYQDNLDTYLRYTGQVDDEGFKLSANAETSGRYHTNWLNMMYPRLKLARNLLRDDGIIFVSIDDHEVQNLRQLMDEVFGSENFVATVIWQKVFSPKNSARHFSEDHDYVVVYARSAEAWRPELLPRTPEMEARYTNPDDDPRGPWTSSDLCARNFYGEGTYPVTCPSGRVIEGPPTGTYWRVSRARFAEMDADNRIYWGDDGNNMPRQKRFLSEVQDGRVPQTLWTYKEVGHTQEAKREMLKRISFDSSAGVFDTPKPTRLIKQMMRIGTRKDSGDIVLDFFAGSGSTGDAVLQLNEEDGGNRRYLLVQLPEPTGQSDYETVADITRARLRAASKAVRTERGDTPDVQSDSRDTGFRAYRLSSSNIRAWDAEFDTIEEDLLNAAKSLKPDRSEEDLLFELLLKYGLDLSMPVEERTISDQTVFVIGAGALVVCLSANIQLDVVAGIAEIRRELRPDVMHVVFADSGFPDDVVKTNAVQVLRRAGVDDVKSV